MLEYAGIDLLFFYFANASGGEYDECSEVIEEAAARRRSAILTDGKHGIAAMDWN